MKHILVAYDGSQPSERAFDFGLTLASKFDSALHVLAVARPPEPPEEVETEAVIESAREQYQRQFKELQARTAKAGTKTTFTVAVGHPAEQILQFAEKHSIDHIVMGHRGRSFFGRWLVGSVSKQVMHYAPCTTTIVR